mgnify:CR=1 FL=1
MAKKIIITGAAGCLGSLLAKHYAAEKCELILVDRNQDALDALASELAEATKVVTLACDLGDEDSYVPLIKDAISGGVDVLINNAAFVGTSGLEGWAEDFEKQSTDAWRKALEVNLVAPFRLCQLCASALRESEDGNIVNISSIYGLGGQILDLYKGTEMKNPAAYGASKAGLIQLTRWMATTLAPDVRVNAVSPGGIERGQPESFVDAYNERTPLRRMATEKDMLGAINYLAGETAGYVTGQNLVVDGGWSAW